MQSPLLRSLAGAALLFAAVCTQARGASPQDRPFAVVEQGRVTTTSGDGTLDRAALDRYAAQHPGSYILFSDAQSLRRLDSAAALAQVKQLQDAMRPLDAQQKALAAQQKPLEQQMKALAAQMRSTPEADGKTRIGAQMNALGAQMGRIGEQQGRTGEQQGRLGRAFHDRIEVLLADCTANQVCPVL